MLPRFSPLYKAGEHISLRVGSDFGHKALTIFSSAIKRQAYVNVRSLHALLDGIVGNVALKITL